MGSLVQLVRDLWRAHEVGGLDAFFEAAGEDVVWQPYITDGRVFHSTAELRETLAALAEQGIRYEPQLHDLEQHGNVVLAHGVLRVSRNGSMDETPLHWAYHFRDGRLRRQTTHASREDGPRGARRPCACSTTATFTLAEDAGSDGERVIRLRGELDIESAPDLERALLRSRPARQRVVLDLGELQVHGLDRAAGAPARAGGRRGGPLGDLPAQRAAEHPTPVRHDGRACGAACRDVLTRRATLRPPRWA